MRDVRRSLPGTLLHCARRYPIVVRAVVDRRSHPDLTSLWPFVLASLACSCLALLGIVSVLTEDDKLGALIFALCCLADAILNAAFVTVTARRRGLR